MKKDTGWAWVISAGATLHVFLLVGLGKSFGIFFVKFLSYYDTNSTVLSGILAAQTLILSLSSLAVLNIGAKVLGNRKLVMIGGFLSSSAYLLNAFATNVIFLVISQSFLYGVGCACTTGPVFVVLNTYFEKRLGFAVSFVYVGGSVGSLIMPNIIQTLLDSYGLQGALLIVSGFLLHNVVVGAIMRPFVSTATEQLDYSKEKYINIPIDDPGNKTQLSLSLDNIFNTSRQIKNNYHIKNDDSYITLLSQELDRKRSLSEDYRIGYIGSDKCIIPKHKFTQFLGNTVQGGFKDNISRLSTNETFYSVGSLCSNRENLDVKQDLENSETKTKICTCQHIIDFKILQNRRLQIFLFVAFFSFCGSGMLVNYIPPFARDLNVPNSKIAILITIVGACDLFARLSLAWITDSKLIRWNNILGIALGVSGIATMFNQLYKSFETLIVFSVFYGLFGSVYFSMSTLLLREGVGQEKMPSALSLMITTHGLSSTLIAPLLGVIRDTMGTYTVSFYLLGIGLIMGSIAIFLQPLAGKPEQVEAKIERNNGEC